MKRIYWAASGIGLVALACYIFVSPFEYEVNFTINTLPGDVIETVRLWSRTDGHNEILKVDSTDRLNLRITRNKRTYIYQWNFKLVSDTSTRVNIRITEPANRLTNKILVPFGNPPIEQDAAEVARQIYEILKVHLDITKVQIEGETSMESRFCACTTLATDQTEKAQGMMRDYSLLTSLIDEFDLKANGPPLVQIHAWNHSLGKLKFDFCFPIEKTGVLPYIEQIHYKEVKGTRALKAVYHGNYITSDRAWYALVHFAKSRDYLVKGLPIEYFYNNPNLGMNESEWKAEIFLPIE